MTTERKIMTILNNLTMKLAKAEERLQILMDSEVKDLDFFELRAEELITEIVTAEGTLNKFKTLLEASKPIAAPVPTVEIAPVPTVGVAPVNA